MNIFQALFPKAPSKRQLEERRLSTVRRIVCASSGFFDYVVTEENIEKRRKLILRKGWIQWAKDRWKLFRLKHSN